MTTVSGVIVARNAAGSIDLTLRSLRPWTDEIIVVDMESVDDTASVAARLGATVITHPAVGYADPARQFAIDAAHSEWIVMMDADEVVPQPLSVLLRRIAEEDSADVVRIPWANYMLGGLAAHGPFAATRDRHPRFFKRWALRPSPEPHAPPWIDPGARIRELEISDRTCVVHLAHRDFGDLLRRADAYTTVQAHHDVAANCVVSTPAALARALRQFVGGYVKHRGYRGGWRGFHLSVFMAYYELVRNAKGRQLRDIGDAEVVGQLYRARGEAVVGDYGSVEPTANSPVT